MLGPSPAPDLPECNTVPVLDFTPAAEPVGYAHPRYALSLREFGEPRELPRSGGWILKRQIQGTTRWDAMGCYPLFTCRDWSRLHEDLEEIQPGLVSLVLVSDPFTKATRADLEEQFQIVRPFKTHFISDLEQNIEEFVSRHHRYYARKALERMQVEFSEEPSRYVEEWTNLYANLIARHGISGMRAFSRACFAEQLQTPGLVMCVGRIDGEVSAAHVLVIDGNTAYSHLAAFSESAYKYRASYGIYLRTLQSLADRGVRYFDLGAAAGLEENGNRGLTMFKMGWSNESRTVYLCGSIFDQEGYAAICRQKGTSDANYFPAYRTGEFLGT